MKILLPTFLSAASALLVPPPTGKYEVAMKIQPITDPSRPYDPWDASNSEKGRQVLFSIFLPVERTSCPPVTVPYMTPRVAALYGQQAAQAGLSDKLFSSFDMEFCDLGRLKSRATRKSYPVVLFTPGLAESRLLYGAGARSLASKGYIVITVDHPFEPDFVEFPDGTVIAGRNISDDEASLDKIVQVSILFRKCKFHILTHVRSDQPTSPL
jgi:predicted dienelactone hydrolase